MVCQHQLSIGQPGLGGDGELVDDAGDLVSLDLLHGAGELFGPGRLTGQRDNGGAVTQYGDGDA